MFSVFRVTFPFSVFPSHFSDIKYQAQSTSRLAEGCDNSFNKINSPSAIIGEALRPQLEHVNGVNV
jgi:hypothetical protein